MPIYLDDAATTPLDPIVIDAMVHSLNTHFGNPSQITQREGYLAREAIEQARAQVASLLGKDVDPHCIIWTSGATEANNLALQGIARFYAHKGRHIITAVTEHSSILKTCQYLNRRGYEITYLPVNPQGLIDLDLLDASLRKDTVLVSIMHVNNETGVIQDIEAIGQRCRQRGIFFHVDAAQSVARIALNLAALPIDLLSLGAHKLYGPKGVGALYINNPSKIRLMPLLHGGGQELGIRSGTLATHQIVGLGTACALVETRDYDALHRATLQQVFLEHMATIPHTHIHSPQSHSVAGLVNISILGLENVQVLEALAPTVSASSMAACSGPFGHSVLEAMGCSENLVRSALRFSFGRMTSMQDLVSALQIIKSTIAHLRG